MSVKADTVDMLNGSILPGIFQFSLPLALSGILQLLFNAADVVVVGKFAGSVALAAVGSTGALINLLIGLFMGIAVGVNVLVARSLGCGDREDVQCLVHSSAALGAVLGAAVFVIGMIFSVPLLRLMDTPEDVLPLASLYLRIYFIGTPFNLLYNFLSAVLRANGDTKRPLYFLAISGVVNLLLNLFFVIVCHLGVAGVAIATVASQILSLVLITGFLMRAEGCIRLQLRKIRLDLPACARIIRIGLPSGLQGVIFSVSNVIIQSSVNSFGSDVMAANTAAANLEGFVNTSCNSIFQAAITFTSQNLGARKYSRIRKVARSSTLAVMIFSVSLCSLLLIFGRQLLGIYVSSADPSYESVLEYGMLRLWIMAPTYFILGLMDVGSGLVKGLGKTWMPMLVSTFGCCLFRIVWIMTAFRWTHSLQILYISYPISWTLTGITHFLCFLTAFRKLPKTDCVPLSESQSKS